jgi:Ca2+/Na+ antiporter
MLKDIEGVPNQIGPIVLVGSGAFNLLVVSALSIMAATETKRVLNLCSFLTTAAFATAAYVWLFVVLLVISPGVVDFSEAMITLLGYPMLILVIWISEKITEDGMTNEE